MPLQPVQPYFGGVQHKRPEEVPRNDAQHGHDKEDGPCPSEKKVRRREEIVTRTIVAALLGLIGGIVAGLILSEIIGIAGYLLFGSAIGIKFLPIYLAVLFTVVAPAVDMRLRRRSGRPLYRRNQRSKP
jgi:hypothetical protein